MKAIKAKVHMLPTKWGYGTIYKSGSVITIHEPRLHKLEWTPQHLYITTDEEIKEGDWVIQQFKGEDADVCQITNGEYEIAPDIQRKIIATTDPKLFVKIEGQKNLEGSLPQIHQSFIEEYCKAGGIDEVLIEYEEFSLNGGGRPNATVLEPKLNPDNTIIIHPVEEKMYSREEVIQVIKGFDGARFAAEHMEKGFDTDKWIEENL